MGVIQYPPVVKAFSAILYSEELALSSVLEELTSFFGEISHRSNDFNFDFTDYYDEQMRAPLKKFFMSFKKLFNREELPQWKTKTNEIEEKYSIKEKGRSLRLVNIDPGYVSRSKVVLATTKNFSHRIYMRDGIFAEITLNFKKGVFAPNPWTFPDYCVEKNLSFFNEVRKSYMEEIK